MSQNISSTCRGGNVDIKYTTTTITSTTPLNGNVCFISQITAEHSATVNDIYKLIVNLVNFRIAQLCL